MRLREHVHHAEHRPQRHDSRRGLLELPPVLHRQAEDPRHRWPRREVREEVRQEPLDQARRQEVTKQTWPWATTPPRRLGGSSPPEPAEPSVSSLRFHVSTKGRPAFDRLSDLVSEQAEL